MAHNGTLTHMLEDGDAESLVPIVYGALDTLIREHVCRDLPLRPYRLVHRLWTELLEESEPRWEWRARLLAEAARPVRRVLVHHARNAALTGRRLQVELLGWPSRGARLDVLELDAALVRLAMIDAHRSRLIELRDLAGLGVDEVAELLDVEPAAALREWAWARTGLMRDLGVIAGPPARGPIDALAGTQGVRR